MSYWHRPGTVVLSPITYDRPPASELRRRRAAGRRQRAARRVHRGR